jgi:hypothetical protein
MKNMTTTEFLEMLKKQEKKEERKKERKKE